MGFIHDVKRIIEDLPKQRQTLLFSATMPRAIEALGRSVLTDPVRITVTPQSTAAETVEQQVYLVDRAGKRDLLSKLLADVAVEKTLVFTRTKRGANRLAEQLESQGIEAAAIHGDKSQNARERALAGFRGGHTRVLVATDVAARGIDVQGVRHVINFELPNVAEAYVHRIGRTGRAGQTGSAISFCDRDERGLLRDIERLLTRRIPLAENGNLMGDDPRYEAGSRPSTGRKNGAPKFSRNGNAPSRARSESPSRDSDASRGGPPRRKFRRSAPNKLQART
jgi:ATP-dependent RNA helicase RhlE